MRRIVLSVCAVMLFAMFAAVLASCETIKTDSERGQYINPAF